MPAVLGLVAVALGLACILADEQISRKVWRTAEDPAGRRHQRPR